MNLTNIHEDVCSIPVLTQWVKGSVIAMSCGVGHKHGSAPSLLWHRLVATALIGPLTCELPYAMGMALKKTKDKK